MRRGKKKSIRRSPFSFHRKQSPKPAVRIDKLYRLGLIERTKGIGYGVYKLSESGENEIKKYNKLIFIMKQRISNWWNGRNRTYATSDEPSPKDAFQVIIFAHLPLMTILYLTIKYTYAKH